MLLQDDDLDSTSTFGSPMPMPTIPIQLPEPVRKTQNHGPKNNGTVNNHNAKNNAIAINITIT
jgi:hypothetical protein